MYERWRTAIGKGISIMGDMFSSVVTFIDDLTSSVKALVTPIAVLAMIICGIMWIGSSEPSTSSKAKSWLIRILIGLAIVYLADVVIAAVASSMASSVSGTSAVIGTIVG